MPRQPSQLSSSDNVTASSSDSSYPTAQVLIRCSVIGGREAWHDGDWQENGRCAEGRSAPTRENGPERTNNRVKAAGRTNTCLVPDQETTPVLSAPVRPK